MALCKTCNSIMSSKRNRCYVCSPAKVKAGEIRNCATCSAEFYVQRNVANDAERNAGKFCSRRCKYEAQRYKGKPESKWLHSAGYVLVWCPTHPRATRGRVLEHILVAEQMLGRPISRDEHVHHIDGNRQNNSPSNLTVVTASEHAKLHYAMRKTA
jgi:predicted amidophosphoribosyltransferase